jgi:ribosomal protein S14
MKKLIIKDKQLRSKIKNDEKKCFVLKTIFQNSNLFSLPRWNAYSQLKKLGKVSSKVSTTYRCVYTINRKRFNKFTPFSRQVFLKLIRSGKLSGLRKSSW